MGQDKTVAIIIPVFNEKDLLADALDHFMSLGADEIILVDGRSTDGTFELIQREFPSIRCYQTASPERSLQMNLGAFESGSDILLFVHVDLRLPSNAIESVKEKIEQGFIGGGFKKRSLSNQFLLNMYLYFLNTIYLGVMHCLVGTNGIFIRREVFEKVHGYPEASFLEDVMFSECIKKEGKIAIIDTPILVSSRRYFQNGILRQILRNGRIILCYHVFHESPSRLRELY